MELKKFDKRIWLSSPTMHGEEQAFVKEAFDTNWVTTIGKNLDELESGVCRYLGGGLHAAGLASGTSALHLAYKLAGVGEGDRVFCSDLTFDATVNPVSYEKGEQVFIDSDIESWNMSPVALRKAFEKYPDTKCVVVVNLYGMPAKLDEIRAICDEYGAVLVEDAAESFGASYKGRKTGTFGHYNVISFNGNKIITTSGGGMLISEDAASIDKAKFLATQAREPYPWYQHEELGYNYRLSNILAGIGRGQLLHLDEHRERKKEIYELYKEGLKNLPVKMNPVLDEAEPNYWLSCLIIDEDAMAPQDRSRFRPNYAGDRSGGTNSFAVREAGFLDEALGPIELRKKEKYKEVDFKDKLYLKESGKSSPEEIRDVLAAYNVESRPIWKPMHLQPYFRGRDFITDKGSIRELGAGFTDIGSDIFDRGLCLPSDIKMRPKEQEVVIEIIKSCFD